MDKLLSQHARGSSFEQPGNIRRKRGGIGPHTQMHMIGLYRQFDELPTIFCDHLRDSLFQPLLNWSGKDRTPPFRTPDKVRDDEMNTIPIRLIFHKS
jgi:hypothetical protein